VLVGVLVVVWAVSAGGGGGGGAAAGTPSPCVFFSFASSCSAFVLDAWYASFHVAFPPGYKGDNGVAVSITIFTPVSSPSCWSFPTSASSNCLLRS